MSNDQQIENEIQAKGLTAPRVTPADLAANIIDTEFVTHVSKGGQVLRWAVLTTRSGYAVVGKPSVAVSPENDNEQIGCQVAYDNSRNELWPLMGYALKERLSNTPPPVDNDHVAPGCEQFSAETIAAANKATGNFGFALAWLKAGNRVARSGWNGKGMWLSLSCNPDGDAAAGSREIAFENFWSNNNSEYARQNGGSAVVLPCITMKTATGEILMGWLASQSDMLADDWVVVL